MRVKARPEQCGQFDSDGRGFKAWETRRANAFLRAVLLIVRQADTAVPEEIIAAARVVADAIAAAAPSGTSLPRGYTISETGLKEPALCHNGVWFNPSFLEELPSRAAIAQLAADIADGWLNEVIAQLGTESSFAQYWKIRSTTLGNLR